jgi:uncharacterized protein (DUF2141 family)
MKPFMIVVAVVSLTSAAAAQAATLEIRVKGVASSKGEILAAVCDRAAFLKKGCIRVTAPAKRGETVLKAQVPGGEWAVSVFHDEDGDRKMARGAMGIPAEGWGFSRDAKGRFGPPTFDEAAVRIGGASAVQTINLTY